LNINHEKGRHDLLKSFYFDFLQCGIDPRKAENYEKGSKTLWANIGAQQFHLPEGKPDAQVLDGEIRLYYDPKAYDKMVKLAEDMKDLKIMKDTKFAVSKVSGMEMLVVDCWGSRFRIISSDKEKDIRGLQKNVDDFDTLGNGMDLQIFTPTNANIAGIGRFYEQIFDTPVMIDENKCVVSMGPRQTLTFTRGDDASFDRNMHVDLRDEPENNPSDKKYYQSNYGPHISLYVRDIRSTFKRAEELGITYVNPRFKRRAYTEDEVVKDCMFRCLDIIDPLNIEDGVILSLEHEVRSVLKADGSLYKSCPFDVIQDGCVV